MCPCISNFVPRTGTWALVRAVLYLRVFGYWSVMANSMAEVSAGRRSKGRCGRLVHLPSEGSSIASGTTTPRLTPASRKNESFGSVF
jgi:hypothetical protein